VRAYICVVLLLFYVGGCVSPVPRDVQSQLAPTGTLRVGLNLSTTLLAVRDPVSGEMRGVAIDISRELGRRMDMPVRFIGYATGQLDQKIGAGEWDVAFFAIEPARAEKVSFSSPYAEIETTYLVRNNSELRNAQDVDREGLTVAVSRGAGYESTLARSLKRAKLLRTGGFAKSIKQLSENKADAVSGLKPQLLEYASATPGFRVVDGNFASVEQAIGVEKGRDAADKYLRSFIDELKQSGFIARSIEANQANGLTIPR
jgi:polar amino acid transport system substrate-binding protein